MTFARNPAVLRMVMDALREGGLIETARSDALADRPGPEVTAAGT